MALLLLTATDVPAQSAGFADATVTTDSEQFDSLRLRSGALIRYASPFEYNGAALQATRYTYQEWRKDASGVVFLHRRQRRDTLEGTLVEAGLVRVSGRTRIVGDASWTVRPNERTGVQLIAAADLVETRRALEDGTAYTFVAASFDRQLTERLTLIGLAGYQHFTDNNERLHARGRLIWSLLPAEGVYAQIRWRGFESEPLGAEPAYFNPERYRQWDAGLYVRRRHAGWMLYGAVSAGQESMSGVDARTTGSLDVRAEGPLPHDMRVVLFASYNRSAGFAIADADQYWYGRAGLTLVVPLNP